MTAREYNFDGLVGPTHNYAGLAHGNLAAASNQGKTSSPRRAALQGLSKMRALMAMGIPQGVLPPHDRPSVDALRRMGFSGSDADVVRIAGMASPVLLANVSSASAMWTANAATVSPSADTVDGRVHFTPANLSSHLHRSIEADFTARVLRAIFADTSRFVVHDPVPFATFGDEGAANHCRLSADHGSAGVELFVHGGSALNRDVSGKFKARQAAEASHIVATAHGLKPGSVALAQQSQTAIDAGAFHNDVVAVSNGPVLFYHETAFDQSEAMIARLAATCEARGFQLIPVMVAASDMPLPEAISSYLFNSQIVTLPDGAMAFILPKEAEETPSARAAVERVLADNGPVREAHFLDLRESMRNGGGPACLRLRVVLTDEEAGALSAGAVLDDAKVTALEGIVRQHYREELTPADLADPLLLEESRRALDGISAVLGLGAIYDFQRV
jgi:succinylarginine dihydrolase